MGGTGDAKKLKESPSESAPDRMIFNSVPGRRVWSPIVPNTGARFISTAGRGVGEGVEVAEGVGEGVDVDPGARVEAGSRVDAGAAVESSEPHATSSNAIEVKIEARRKSVVTERI